MTREALATRKALVLFSGGQDSTICLAWALQRFTEVETIGFDYGQRHRVELDCRLKVRDELVADFPWAAHLGADHLIDLGVLGEISATALTDDVEIAMRDDGLPNTFVPGRNLLFLTLAAAIAYRRGLSVLVGGMCETDFSGYPDCRDETIKALEKATNLGMERDFEFATPLMFIDKAGSWRLAAELGGDGFISLLCEHTHTCYLGERDHRHAWGYGCGDCPACELRARGYVQWQEERRQEEQRQEKRL